MSEHDPLCEPPGNMDDLNCCCEFVARIRADERAKFKPYVTAGAVQRVEALPGYALRDTCLAAIKGDQP